MLVLVKTPHIEMKGDVPGKYISMLQKDYGTDNVIIKNDEWSIAKDTDIYKTTKAKMKPKDYVRAYRETRGWTQSELGQKLDGLTRQRISDIESGRRPISIDIAKKLVSIFNTDIEKFI